MEVAKPIIRKIDDTPESLKIFEEDLCLIRMKTYRK